MFSDKFLDKISSNKFIESTFNSRPHMVCIYGCASPLGEPRLSRGGTTNDSCLSESLYVAIDRGGNSPRHVLDTSCD